MVGIEGESALPSPLGSTLVRTPVWCGSKPVSKEDRAGEHCGVLQKAIVNRAPSFSSFRLFGRSAGPGRRADSWSDIKRSTCGRWGVGAASAPLLVVKNCLRVHIGFMDTSGYINDNHRGWFSPDQMMDSRRRPL